MIKFNPNKSKKMNMTLEAVGVDNKKINPADFFKK
jgi:hypothetical protein